MRKAKRPGSGSRSGEKSRRENIKIAQAKYGPDDLLKERNQRSTGGRKSKSSSQGPQQSNDPDPVNCDPFESELLKPEETARFLVMSESWLAKARMKGDGPLFQKLGRAVRYRKRDLVAWLATRVKTSTSQ
jgi:predicted DNA-binding transcriptional regulator AlpA